MTHFVLWNLGLAQPQTRVTPGEHACLLRHAAGKKRLAEIGVFHGVTTSKLRRVMAPDGVLIGVDPFLGGRLGFSAHRYIAQRETAKIRNGTMQWMRLTAVEAARTLATSASPPFDFVFSDAENTYAGFRAMWESWAPLIAPDGIVALNTSRSSDVRQFDDAGSAIVTREVVLSDPCFELVETVEIVSVLRRVASRG